MEMDFRKEQTIDNLVDSLESLRNGDIQPGGMDYEYMLDELVTVREWIHQEEVTEGRWLAEFGVIVKRGYPLPKPFENFEATSASTGKRYSVAVKEIVDIEWHDDGIIVRVLGHRTKEKDTNG